MFGRFQADPAADLVAIHIRQPFVQQDDVEVVVPQGAYSGMARLGLHDMKQGWLEYFLLQVALTRFVVDYQHPIGGSVAVTFLTGDDEAGIIVHGCRPSGGLETV